MQLSALNIEDVSIRKVVTGHQWVNMDLTKLVPEEAMLPTIHNVMGSWKIVFHRLLEHKH